MRNDRQLYLNILGRVTAGWLVGSDDSLDLGHVTKEQLAAYIQAKWAEYDKLPEGKAKDVVRGHLRSLAFADLVNWGSITPGVSEADVADLIKLVEARGTTELLPVGQAPNPGIVTKSE